MSCLTTSQQQAVISALHAKMRHMRCGACTVIGKNGIVITVTSYAKPHDSVTVLYGVEDLIVCYHRQYNEHTGGQDVPIADPDCFKKTIKYLEEIFDANTQRQRNSKTTRRDSQTDR